MLEGVSQDFGKEWKEEYYGRVGGMSAWEGFVIVVMELEGVEEIDGREGFLRGIQCRIDQIPVSGTAGNPFQKLYDKGLG